MKLEVKDINGKAVKTIEMPEAIYGVEMNEHALHTVSKALLANRRQGTHSTKTRSTVAGGGKKPFKQKGTGNARQGSSRVPSMPGGAVAHGPQPRDYTQKVNKKLRQLAMRVALSDKLRHDRLVVVDDFAVSGYSTKHVVGAMKTLSSGKALLADERKDDLLYRSTKNIYGATCVQASEMNILDLLGHETLIISETALSTIQQRLG